MESLEEFPEIISQSTPFDWRLFRGISEEIYENFPKKISEVISEGVHGRVLEYIQLKAFKKKGFVKISERNCGETLKKFSKELPQHGRFFERNFLMHF